MRTASYSINDEEYEVFVIVGSPRKSIMAVHLLKEILNENIIFDEETWSAADQLAKLKSRCATAEGGMAKLKLDNFSSFGRACKRGGMNMKINWIPTDKL